MIELINLNKTYTSRQGTVTALKDVSLSISAGEIFGVIGPSGAGKSSLIRCVNLLESPTHGEIKIDGQSLNSLSLPQLRQIRHQIAMIFQHFNLLSRKTAFENIALPLILQKYDKKTIEEKVTSLLELVELQDKRHAYPAQLSGGQKQRVAIARALASSPKVLLCDEATSALDAKTTDAVLALLQKINRQFNLTILLITHQIEVVKTICDRVAVMDQGRIIEQADTVKLFSNPQTSLAKALIHSYLRQDLPQAIMAHIKLEPQNGYLPLLQITFFGDAASKPIIANLTQQLGVSINILQANLGYIREQAMGRMVIAVMDDSHKLPPILDYLLQHGLKVEILGYVPANRI